MSKIILVVAAHTDDEALGCAGAIMKHISSGDMVHLLFMTNGVGAREESEVEINKRRLASEQAAQLMGVSSVTNLNFPDNRLDTVPLLDVVKEIERKLDQCKPELVYTHYEYDLNVDHQITYNATMTACRPYPNQPVREIYSFEVLSSSDWSARGHGMFCPNIYTDISNFIDKKIKVLECYNAEMRLPPHSRSIDNMTNLAKFRGNSIGLQYAEAFCLIRGIKD